MPSIINNYVDPENLGLGHFFFIDQIDNTDLGITPYRIASSLYKFT